MSIVVGVRKGPDTIIASDTQNNFGSQVMTPENHRTSKIHNLGSAYLGTTGWGLYDNILRDFLAHERKVELTDQGSIFAFFLKFWKALHDHYTFVDDKRDSDDESPFADIDASFLVVNPGGIFYVASDLSVTAFKQYFAIGSGSNYSLGTLHGLYESQMGAEELAGAAVDSAIAFDVYCGGKVELKKIVARQP